MAVKLRWARILNSHDLLLSTLCIVDYGLYDKDENIEAMCGSPYGYLGGGSAIRAAIARPVTDGPVKNCTFSKFYLT